MGEAGSEFPHLGSKHTAGTRRTRGALGGAPRRTEGKAEGLLSRKEREEANRSRGWMTTQVWVHRELGPEGGGGLEGRGAHMGAERASLITRIPTGVQPRGGQGPSTRAWQVAFFFAPTHPSSPWDWVTSGATCRGAVDTGAPAGGGAVPAGRGQTPGGEREARGSQLPRAGPPPPAQRPPAPTSTAESTQVFKASECQRPRQRADEPCVCL